MTSKVMDTKILLMRKRRTPTADESIWTAAETIGGAHAEWTRTTDSADPSHKLSVTIGYRPDIKQVWRVRYDDDLWDIESLVHKLRDDTTTIFLAAID